MKPNALAPTRITKGQIAFSVLALAVSVFLPWMLDAFHVRIMQQILLFSALAISWGMLGGMTNYWSFGHTAFFGLGAFAAGLLEQHIGADMAAGARMILGILFAAGVAAVVAALIAVFVLRLRGIYFAIAMLAVAEILGEASRNFDVLQGAFGFAFPAVSVQGVTKVQLFYYLFLLLFVATALIFIWLRGSRLGVGLTCIGQDEDTAAMLGVPTERYKRLAFMVGAVLAAIGGAIYGHSLGFISTGSVFRTDISLNVILFCMIGGMGTVLGPLLGGALMIVMTQVVLGDMLNSHMMLTGILLIVIVLVAPKGIIGLARDCREKRRGRTPTGQDRGSGPPAGVAPQPSESTR